ncbi:MAG: hypothetical protein ABL927_12060, partial [Bdellovibrionales bacterium]
VLQAKNAPQISFADLDGQKRIFLGIPKNLSVLSQKIPDLATVLVKEVNSKRGTPDASVYVLGFNEIVREMSARCNGGAPILSPDFEKVFFAAIPDSIDPTRLDSTKVTALRTIHYAAFKIFTEIAATNADLNKVLEKYKDMIVERDANRSRTTQIQSVELPRTKSELSSALKQQADARAEIAKLNKLIPTLQAKVDASQKLLDSAQAILAPLIPEHDAIVADINYAQSQLNQSRDRLNFIDNRLRDNDQLIRDLNSELNDIARAAPRKRNDLMRAQNFYRDAYTRRTQYNMSWERDNRLRSDAAYQKGLIAQADLQQKIKALSDAARPLIEQRNALDKALKECMTTAGADCSKQKADLEQAIVNLKNNENEQRTANEQLRQVANRMADIDNRSKSEVQQEYNQLVNQENQAIRTLDNIKEDIRRDELRTSQIQNREIPRIERESDDLTAERPSVLSEISRSTANVNRYTNELNLFNTKNGWDRKVAAVDSANRQLQYDNNQLYLAINQKAVS